MASNTVISIPEFFQRPAYGAFAGVFCALIGFITSYFLFTGNENIVGIGAILFATILAIPFLNTLFVKYEKISAQSRRERVFHAYKPFIDYITTFFVGMFITYFILTLFVPNLVFSKENMLGIAKTWEAQKITTLLPPPPMETQIWRDIFSIFIHNITVMLISFALSLFFGAGALFLIALNASIFAAELARVVHVTIPLKSTFLTAYSFIACNLSIMLLHTLPEAAGYLLSAICGGIIGRALLTEKINSKAFYFVKKDVLAILLMSIIVLFIAAIIEMAISKQLFITQVCTWNRKLVLITAASMLALVTLFEFYRRKHQCA